MDGTCKSPFFCSPCRKVVLIATSFTCKFLNTLTCSRILMFICKSTDAKATEFLPYFDVGPFATKQALCISMNTTLCFESCITAYDWSLVVLFESIFYLLYKDANPPAQYAASFHFCALAAGSHWTSFHELVLNLSFVHPLQLILSGGTHLLNLGDLNSNSGSDGVWAPSECHPISDSSDSFSVVTSHCASSSSSFCISPKWKWVPIIKYYFHLLLVNGFADN